MRTGRALLAAVGNTPLINLSDLPGIPDGVEVHAKLESFNPGGSIKDRPVSRMITNALDAGHLEGKRLLDSSSGNAGIAYALFGAALKVDVTLVVPGNASAERLDRIRAHGAELVLTDPLEGYDHALRECRRLAEENPDLYWHCDQYSNDDNWLAHHKGTAVEILDRLRPDAFVGGVGTGGAITGIGRRFKEKDPGIHVRAVIPDVFPGIEGLKPLGDPDDIVPKILDESIVDDRVDTSIEEALKWCRILAARGIYVGPSSGAYIGAAVDLANRGDRKLIVTLLNDTGERYVSTGMWKSVPT